MKKIMVTTVDNPYDPFIHFKEWLMFDTIKGYFTPNRLAKVTITSDQLSDEENYESIEEGIDELIRYGAIDKEGNIVEFKKIIKE